MPTEKESCPVCGALPCDWVDDPHQAESALCMALADIRRVAGVGVRPMLSELPAAIEARLNGAGTILAALCHLTDNPPTSTFFGKDLAEWRHRGRLWLLNEAPPEKPA